MKAIVQDRFGPPDVLQFADMKDRANDGGEFSGVAWTTGLRVGW